MGCKMTNDPKKIFTHEMIRDAAMAANEAQRKVMMELYYCAKCGQMTNHKLVSEHDRELIESILQDLEDNWSLSNYENIRDHIRAKYQGEK